MTQKCLKCGAPISGFLSKIAWFAGVKPSKVKSGYCNKCEASVDGGLGTSNQELEKEKIITPSPAPSYESPVPTPVPPVVPEQTPVTPEVKDIFDEVGKK